MSASFLSQPSLDGSELSLCAPRASAGLRVLGARESPVAGDMCLAHLARAWGGSTGVGTCQLLGKELGV